MTRTTPDVKVLIAVELDERHLARIRDVSPRLDVMYQPCQPPERLALHLATAEVLHTHDVSFNPSVAPHLKWIQLTGAGIDYLQGQPVMRSSLVITNAHVFATPIAEYVFASMLGLARRLPQMLREFQTQRVWPADPGRAYRGTELYCSTLGVVGYGDIGRAVARLGRCFGMRVVATRATASHPYQEDGIEIIPADGLRDLLVVSDFVVLCVPLSPQTEGLIGAEELKAMRPNAYLINVARGGVIDETALIAALREQRIAGAVLDTFALEPLPRHSELFDLPNVILTPHIAGLSTAYGDRITKLFCENLRRYLNGETLLNQVDKGRGY